MLLEPLAEPDRRRSRLRPYGSFRLPVVSDRSLRGALAGAGLAATLVGLLGVDAGLVLVVLGVWTARAAVGAPPGVPWAIACVAAGLRWGTISMSDLSAATRAVGAPTILVKPLPAAAGACLVLLAALADESSRADLRSIEPVRRATGGAALLCLVPSFLVPGAGRPNLLLSLLLWVAASVVLAGVAGVVSPLARRVPSGALAGLAAAGLFMVGIGRGPG